MIELRSQLSPSWKAQVRPEDVVTATDSDLRYAFFLGDIHFAVNGVDFSARWDWIPILDFALCLRSVVEDLEAGGVETLEFTESEAMIEFKLDSGLVRVAANYVSDASVVPYDSLQNAVKTFAQDVKADLVAEFPGLLVNEAFKVYQSEVSEGGTGK